MDDKDLNHKLNNIRTPESLEKKIRHNWQQQLTQSKHRRGMTTRILMATAASFLVAAIVLRSVLSTPTIVTDALADIIADKKHAIGISVPIETILASQKIQAPIENMPVELTKFCNLNQQNTIHMQVAGANQGHVHLFVKEGGFEKDAWQDNSGVTNDMTWKILYPRDDLSVLVIHTADMNPLNVEKLIQHMFYS